MEGFLLQLMYDSRMQFHRNLFTSIYSLLYHQLAWAYNDIAAVVSLGKWNPWVQTILPFSKGRVLELGFGTGRLQRLFVENRVFACGVDESRQMINQSRRFLRKNSVLLRIIRGYAQHLPFISEYFDTVVSTFPADYIFDPRTILEIKRVLVPTGKFILLPSAWITGIRISDRLWAWLFRRLGLTKGELRSVATSIKDQFIQYGFEMQSKIISLKGSQVLIIKATKLPGL
jgi:ubiquinone/menaquinone biosynthesis C-methylase UbiE